MVIIADLASHYLSKCRIWGGSGKDGEPPDEKHIRFLSHRNILS
jgi:hypothetical protein